MSFIKEVINDLILQNIDFSNSTLILPNKRSLLFFKKEFQYINYQGILPQFSTIHDFVEKISGLNIADPLLLWLESYFIQNESISEDKFENFLYKIPTILKDFDDIDMFSSNPDKTLEHLCSIERIENWGNNLSDDSLTHKNIEFWKNNYILYKKIHKELPKKGIGTRGIIYRRALKRIKNIKFPEEHTFIFVGFNALIPVEEKLIKNLTSTYKTLFYWDTDKHYMDSKIQEAGHFLRKYQRLGQNKNYPFKWIKDHFSQYKNLSIISVSQDITQVKYATKILSGFTRGELSRTVLVLCEEKLLSGIIESLPENISSVTINIGSTLKNSSLTGLFKSVFKLHSFKEKQKVHYQKTYYYRDILNLLNFYSSDPLISDFIYEIKKNNKIFISAEDLKKIDQWKYFFLLNNYIYPNELLKKLMNYCELSGQNENDILLKEYFLQFKKIFATLYSQLSDKKITYSFSVLYKLYIYLLNYNKIHFSGESSECLHIMEIAETRLLDFDNIIMLNVNEEILPKKKIDNSFIPFDIRKSYGLPTYIENDAIYAYYFYRLLQRAKNIYLIYNNYSEGLNSGEKSRFINQLEFENTNMKVTEHVAGFSGDLEQNQLVEVKKTEYIQNLIQRWLEGEVSPTHLVRYHYNPINFYLQNLLKINREEEIEEEISDLRYGSLIHNALEFLYQPYKNNYLNKDILNKMLNTHQQIIEHFISIEPNQEIFLSGHNYLKKLIAQETVKKIIEKDLKDIEENNEIFLKDIEMNIKSIINIDNNYVKINGIIDRWDVVNGIDRIIDYKSSGIDKLEFNNTYTIANSKNFRYFIQLIFYCYIMLNEKKVDQIASGIWSLKKPLQGAKMLFINQKYIYNFDEVKIFFEEIKNLIREIVNSEIPFIEKNK